ncbi:hypothetical protein [Symbiopectobacterium purcellii]|uniref:hypothetical protein n=1 Tax=Symbiopectobacterium purcellii TaxID=2871826 RepID=UPI003F857202
MINQTSTLSSYCNSLNTYKQDVICDQVSVFRDVVDSSKNKVHLSDDAKKILNVITLGLSHYIIQFIEWRLSETALADYIEVTETLINAFDTETQCIKIPLGKGKHIEFNQAASEGENFETIVTEIHPKIFRTLKYKDQELKINKSLSQIAEMLVADVINNKERLESRFTSLITRAECIHERLVKKQEESTVAPDTNLRHDITHPMKYEKKTVSAKLNELHTDGTSLLTYLSKGKTFLGMKFDEHKVLGVTSLSGKKYIFSLSHGELKNIGHEDGVCYFKLSIGRKKKSKDILKVYNELVNIANKYGLTDHNIKVFAKEKNPDLNFQINNTEGYLKHVNDHNPFLENKKPLSYMY